MDGFVLVAVLFCVAGALWYVWKHRTGRAARAIGAAGARYNELNGQGGPPRMLPPAVAGSVDPLEFDTDTQVTATRDGITATRNRQSGAAGRSKRAR